MLLPKLPSNGATDKENATIDGNKVGLGAAAKSLSTPSIREPPSSSISATQRHTFGLLTPQQLVYSTTKKKPLLSGSRGGTVADSTTTSTNTSTPSVGNPRRVLRYGETMDSLFCLTEKTSYTHRKLCRDILDGSATDDPSAWRTVIQMAIDDVSANEIDRFGTDFIRLHRRATVRFPLDNKTEDAAAHMSEDTLEIWLSYARAQEKYRSPDEARMTYRYIQNQGTVKWASFYLAYASFEENFDPFRAREILKAGVKDGAEPLHALRDAILKLSDDSTATVRIEHRQPSSIPPLPRRRERLEISIGEDHPGVSVSNFSPKRRRIDNGVNEFSLKNSSPTVNLVKDSKLPSARIPGSSLKSAAKSAHAVASLSSSGQKARKSGDFTGRRRNLMSKTFNLGKAKRVDPETSFVDGNRSPSEIKTSEIHCESTSVLERVSDDPLDKTEQKQVKAISKVELNYMWQWDPSSRSKEAKTDTTHSTEKFNSNTTTTAEVFNPALTSTTMTDSTSGTASSICNITQDSDKRDSKAKNDGQKVVTSTSPPPVPTPVLKSTEELNRRDSETQLSDKYDTDFLPLVNRNNIIPVNDVHYVKLGVIGKGGSCKVYRALSKKCNVLAIKKVKLDGMDQNAIEGYANEISLLKRLRGNPAIIQMYDSEVDLERKSIYLVMEVGEVDLNQVLQQQALSNNNNNNTHQPSSGDPIMGGRPRSLNMNFIRLTWQQMLSAVHSIHEERIIHSDLKPANFLFVRGALKLIDFGIAKAIQSDETQNVYRETQVGTLNYMSPEAILDTGSDHDGKRHRIGKPSDVWSLGCILYQMVYGKTPFAELHFIQKLQAIVDPNYQIKFPGDVESAAIHAIKSCLCRQPEERLPIVGENGLLDKHPFLNSR